MYGVQIQKPRVFQSTKDIVLSLGVLLFATFLVVGFTGLCSFNPGSPEQSSANVQEVDKDTILRMDAQGLSMPIRNPEMPEGWIANSARRTMVGKEPSSLVGWVVEGEHYISLTQTTADMKAARQPDQDVREETGTEQIGDLTWHIMEGDDARPLWVADAGETRLILEGMATQDQMRTAAEKVTATEPMEL
ncbi:MAG TPA: DUF4245 domain-containing protein [Candidatus Corynebacterium gallistercoris]|uniref:DUF4245 domain-containing protein n=1 Tax=Candidatus Corynebacterium gallistercoris TaxID=2838530 RepID=A0A9D1RZN4_9CORY|nr:DUF4245 domain-containing protein [Candidatus Corynebacterium gallistercoris]